jgi:hypothetical protein
MKQKDLVLLIVVAVVSIAISSFVSKLVFSTPANRSQQVDVVPVISSSFPVPSSQYFNNSMIDPTQLITIGNNNNPTPFNGSSNQ